ncbi:type II toxin-antitoxin system RelE/ParE family toxin [Chlorobaculum sp. 24CR]|uniref:type II toxin-antitoxin system RelE/ParE family toxin n=1 Tax=Chlorobaculum sp. 24CR TaxID=2508878 RepID=UPI00100A6A8A|nr:type II toxin-antitoxin system RelE/ParE family toxin [Chlorobaculum sp. 24CR]RXK88263.1 type II toxin-antitoxin system RelE/ParE family toxin [Chlorobaculum sp. 24CR]
MNVVWTETALKRLDEIEAYIKQESERAARKTILSLVNKTIEQLTHYPGSGKPGRLYGTRELFFLDIPYLVVYTADTEKVTVITVFHTAQNYHP